jgi:DHA2 family multidrug resistance protein
MAAPPAHAGPPPLEGSKRWITAIALAVVTFMQVLDTTIANVSLPTISGYLGTSTDQGTWMITGFAAANGVGVPLTGWLMGRYGVVRTFVFAVIGFTAASFMCGIAWSLPALILFRVLQGMLSGPMIPGSQALLMGIFPQRQRALALGLWSMTTLVAPVVGPILGGWISDNYYWGWIFLINVPLGLGAATLCWINLRDRETPTRKLPIDKVGLVLLVVWVGALQALLDKGKDLDWFDSRFIVVLAIVSVLAFATWIIWELTEEHPVVDLSLFKGRNFAFGTIAFCLMYAVFWATRC